jgi:multidrug efflux pump subunit AcrA (membrane-fusion protein)
VRASDRSVQVFLERENADLRLLPGMTGTMSVVVAPAASDEILAVPRGAVLSDGGREYVVVESGDSFARVETETGRSDDRFVEVSRGVYPGDRVLVRGAAAIRSALAGVR